MRSIHAALFFCLLPLGNCACGCQPPICDWSGVAPVVPEVRDAQGNKVPLTSVSMQQGTEPVACETDDGSGRYVCHPESNEEATLTIEAEGETITHTFAPSNGCNYETIPLRLAAEGCPAPSGTAIEGRLRDVTGAPADGEVAVYLAGGGIVPCEVQAGTFHCESQSAYDATYRLRAQLGTTRLEREIRVPVEECEFQVADATIDLSAFKCEERAWALSGSIRARPGATLSVRASVDGGERHDCVQQLDKPDDGDSIVRYFCKALTPTGGGSYLLELSDGRRTQEESFEVSDDGCKPKTVTNALAFR
jgi:hypothetical protein